MLWQVLQRLWVHDEMLAAIHESIYKDKDLSVNISDRVGHAVSSQTVVKKGCPLSPTLSGLLADSLHRCLKLCCPDEGFHLLMAPWFQIWASR